MNGGTLFSGIGAPELALPWVDWRWCAEIEPFPAAVHAARFGTRNLGDVTTADWSSVEPIDILVFGSPCQSFSVAGKRLGLDDPRGNLALVALQIVSKLRPQYFIFENVPGLISQNDGDDLRQLMDEIERLRYVVDIDVLDAQFSGVPQRRRRVFVCAQTADSILSERTISSALTISQCVAEILHLILAVHSGRSIAACGNLGFDDSEPLRSLHRRMTLFGLHGAERASMLLDSLGAILASSECAHGDLASPHGNSFPEDSRNFADTKSQRSSAATASCRVECQNTVSSPRENLAVVLATASACITSTSKNATTNQAIFSCAQILLHIAEHITPSMNSSPCFWSAASSVSTALREFTNYARQTSSDLFGDVGRVRAWHDFIGQAGRAIDAIGNIGVRNFGQVLPLAESLRWNPPPGREAGEGVAASLTVGAGGSSGHQYRQKGGEQNVVAMSLNAKGGSGRIDGESETFILDLENMGDGGNIGFRSAQEASITLNTSGNIGIAHSLRADGFDASEDGTGRGTPLVAFQSKASSSQSMNPSGIVPSLDRAKAGGTAIAFTSKDQGADAGDVAPTLRSMGHDKSHPNGGGQVAVLIETLQRQGYDAAHASAQEADARETLRVLQDAVGAQAFAQWRSGILNSLQSPEVLQSTLHGAGVRRAAREAGLWVDDGALPRAEDLPAGAMRNLWQDGPDGRSPQGLRLAQQLAGQSATSLPGRPHPGASVSRSAVRRLTPREAERLQGFPDDFTAITYRGKPAADGPRYKAIGNSMAVPVVSWIGDRIRLAARSAA